MVRSPNANSVDDSVLPAREESDPVASVDSSFKSDDSYPEVVKNNMSLVASTEEECSVYTNDNSDGWSDQHGESEEGDANSVDSILADDTFSVTSSRSRSGTDDASDTNSNTPQRSAVTITRRLTCQNQNQHMTQRRQLPTVATTEGPSLCSLADESVEQTVIVLGIDISHMSGSSQFMVCVAGVFAFNLSFGFLQEFVSVEICNRNLGLFLALMEFTGYTVLSYILRSCANHNKEAAAKAQDKVQMNTYPVVPTYMYLGLGVLSAVDMAMTNMAMHYINYPAKTLMKSSRVVFTMIFGVLLAGKRYRLVDYLLVFCMVAGLAIFMNADASSSAIFEPMGVVMVTISLLCDGANNIISENIMKNYGVGQDELIFNMYSLALMAVLATAAVEGDLRLGFMWMMKPGTYNEWIEGVSEDEVTWNALGKITMIVLFSSMGFFGHSCSAAITKNFGALTMAMTSTARRATTLFISFFLFDNECTYEHLAGVVVFIAAMATKSVMGGPKRTKLTAPPSPQLLPSKDIEMGRTFAVAQGGSAGSAAAERSPLLELDERMPRQSDLSRRTRSGK